MILGGDFNQNLTDLGAVRGWSVLSVDVDENALLGTTQKELNWMGNFDGFLLRVGDDDGAAAMEHARPTVLPE